MHTCNNVVITKPRCNVSDRFPRIKTYLRTIMTEKRLTDITLLSIENNLMDSICLDDKRMLP